MALGRQGERQTDLIVGWAELPRSPGHAFYDRLQTVLLQAGFDGFAEQQCAPYYASKQGRPSLPPGRHALIVDCRVAESGAVRRFTLEEELEAGGRYRIVAQATSRNCEAVALVAD